MPAVLYHNKDRKSEFRKIETKIQLNKLDILILSVNLSLVIMSELNIKINSLLLFSMHEYQSIKKAKSGSSKNFLR